MTVPLLMLNKAPVRKETITSLIHVSPECSRREILTHNFKYSNFSELNQLMQPFGNVISCCNLRQAWKVVRCNWMCQKIPLL